MAAETFKMGYMSERAQGLGAASPSPGSGFSKPLSYKWNMLSSFFYFNLPLSFFKNETGPLPLHYFLEN